MPQLLSTCWLCVNLTGIRCKISEVMTVEGFLAKNALVGPNTNWVNFFDLCAISLPLPREGGLPVGLMLVARNGHDHRLFRIAAAVEQLFAA